MICPTLDLKPTHRGFLHGEFRDGNGESCSIQESSAAEADFLWLGLDGITQDHARHMDGRFPGEDIPARMHLTRDNAAALIPLLERFAATGFLRDSGVCLGGLEYEPGAQPIPITDPDTPAATEAAERGQYADDYRAAEIAKAPSEEDGAPC